MEGQRTRLEDLLTVPAQGRSSPRLDKLRSGPMCVSGCSPVHAIRRLQTVQDLGIKLPPCRRSTELIDPLR